MTKSLAICRACDGAIVAGTWLSGRIVNGGTCRGGELGQAARSIALPFPGGGALTSARHAASAVVAAAPDTRVCDRDNLSRTRGAYCSMRGRIPQTMSKAVSTPTFAPNSVWAGATKRAASSPIETAYTIRPLPVAGIVLGSVIMKNRNTRISGDE